VLLDFGLAKAFGAAHRRDDGVIFEGTIGYAAPERLWGAEPAPASDWYSFGATLLETFGGHLPGSPDAAAASNVADLLDAETSRGSQRKPRPLLY